MDNKWLDRNCESKWFSRQRLFQDFANSLLYVLAFSSLPRTGTEFYDSNTWSSSYYTAPKIFAYMVWIGIVDIQQQEQNQKALKRQSLLWHCSTITRKVSSLWAKQTLPGNGCSTGSCIQAGRGYFMKPFLIICLQHVTQLSACVNPNQKANISANLVKSNGQWFFSLHQLACFLQQQLSVLPASKRSIRNRVLTL